MQFLSGTVNQDVIEENNHWPSQQGSKKYHSSSPEKWPECYKDLTVWLCIRNAHRVSEMLSSGYLMGANESGGTLMWGLAWKIFWPLPIHPRAHQWWAREIGLSLLMHLRCDNQHTYARTHLFLEEKNWRRERTAAGLNPTIGQKLRDPRLNLKLLGVRISIRPNID